MVESEKSGIAFSVHPVTEDYNQLIIEAGYGLGESIVSGQITPDSYVVEKEPRQIIDKNIVTQERLLTRANKGTGNEWQEIPKEQGEKQTLSDKEILKLSKLILKIEKHYGTPQDIEWAYENNKFYIVQSRPVTTLSGALEEKRAPSLIKIEKTISRDLPLANIYAWHKGYTEGMRKWLGWSYSDTLFYVHDGFVDIMRTPKEHLVDFKDVISRKIDEDKNWFSREYRKFLSDTERIYAFYDQYESGLETFSKKKLSDFYKHYVQCITEIMGPFITMLWFPIWCENDKEFTVKYSDEIKLGIDARKTSEQIFPRGDALIRRLLKIVNNKLRLDERFLKVISYQELLVYLWKGKLPDLEILKKRAEGFIYNKHGIVFVDTAKNDIANVFAQLGYAYDLPNYSALLEIRGNSAYSGKVRGIVRVVMQKSTIGELLEGEILVASMTTPEYIPAMKKSAAFVTDEGGITCHAAIVAREMKKPCIIGTKIATQVLHDGDLVEVDANVGMVKILKRAGK
jgi:phosphohistidine swiveling domain-containing protein